MGQNKKSEQVVMKDWKDWFENCRELQQPLEKYEADMMKYYNKQFPKTEEAQMQKDKAYESKHKSSFYMKEPLVPKWKMGVMFKFGLFSWIIGFGVTFVILLILNTVNKGNATIPSMLIKGAVIGFGIGILIALLICVSHCLSVNGIRKRLKKQETLLKERISFVPPKYRNSAATGFICELYDNYGSVLTYGQALEECDNYLQGNNLIGAYMAVMFDEPYDLSLLNGSEGGGDSRGLYHGEENPLAMQDPNLPEDIKSKTYSGTEHAEEELKKLVGLDNVKLQIQQMKNRMEFYKGTSERISGNNMCFIGPPGTGKTTIARIVTKILYDFGYIRDNKCVELDGGYLKSPYQGQTEPRVNAIVKYALGGVLFIDEAYLLLDDNGGTGSEATGVLLKAMEDHKNDLVVIFAGYEDAVNRLIASNEGFSSRIKYKVYFEDFTSEQMMQIFHMLMKKFSANGEYVLDKKAEALLKKHFEKERGLPGFGNARVVRNALDVILDIHADHFMKNELTEDEKYVFTEKDIKAYVKIRSKQMQEDARNFIASQNLDNSIVSLSELKGRTKDGSVNPEKDLEALTGLEVVKEEFAKMKAQYEFYDGKLESEGYHMCFVGPPGTGKTTVASIMTGYLYKMGIIRDNKYIDINGDFLRGQYLGHTGKRTEAVVKYSQGMVLFIDEAYLLQSSDDSDKFGQEAIGVLLDAMEKYRKNFVVIFAGYEREMDYFLNANSGLRSRISQTFHFKSYSPHELANMMKNLAKKDHFKVEKDVWIPLQKYLKQKMQEPYFGNARFIRSFFEKAKKQHIVNFSNNMYDESYKYVITLQDVEPLFTLEDELM